MNNFLLNNFNRLASTPENVTELKKLVLQLAVQGRLTANFRKENKSQLEAETGAMLLEKVRAEKIQLIKVGKLKAEKPLPPISKSEIPFEIPDTWVWCRLGKYILNRDERRIPLSKKERELRKGKYDYYGASGVIDKIDDYLYDGQYVLIGEDGANLISRSTPIAFIAKGKFWVNNHAHVLECLPFTSIKFFERFLNAINLEAFVTGGFQPKLNQANLNLIPIAIPPIEEQHVIVNIIDKLFNSLNELEKQIIER